MRKAVKTVFACLTVLILLAGCMTSGNAIKYDLSIGVALPSRGPGQEFSERALAAIQLATEEANRLGGVGGKRVRLIMADTASGVEQAAQRLISGDQVAVIVGGGTPQESQILQQAAAANKFPVLLLQSDLEQKSASGWVTRCGLSDTTQARALAYYLRYELRLSQMAILMPVDQAQSYHRSLSWQIGQAFTDFQGEVKSAVGITKTGLADETELKDLLGKKPEVILVVAEAETTLKMIKKLRQMRYTGLIAGADNFDDELLQKELPPNCIYSTICNHQLDTRLFREFAPKVEARTSKRIGNAEILSYDAMALIFAASRRAQSSYDIAYEIDRMRSFAALSGALQLGDRQIIRPVPILRMTPGGVKLLKAIDSALYNKKSVYQK